MEINKIQNDDELIVEVIEKLDAVTSPTFEKEVVPLIKGVKSFILDFSKCTYVASAGLRVIFLLQKKMAKQGKMTLKNVSPDIKNILVMTGFIKFLHLE